MFKRFQRKPKEQPVDDLDASFLDVPTIETPTVKPVQPESMQFCAACGIVGATHAVKGGDWFLGPITLRLCDACLNRRIEKHCDHSFKQRKEYPDTQVRIVAINAAKIRAREA